MLTNVEMQEHASFALSPKGPKPLFAFLIESASLLKDSGRGPNDSINLSICSWLYSSIMPGFLRFYMGVYITTKYIYNTI